jgi:multicomponent Na+:H+ antiporter subunit D
MDSFPPALIVLIAAVIVPLLPSAVRPWAFLVAPVLAFVQILVVLEPEDATHFDWLNLELLPMHVTELNEVWATVFALVGIAGGAFALHMKDRVQQGAALAYLGSALGVVFAGDLLTLITFWEIMAVASMLLIMNGGRTLSKPAALRYLFVHIAGGSLLLGGILWHVGETGSLELMRFDQTGAGWLMFFGVAINAAIVPLHAWLPDAYPESSATGMVFLGAFTTKTAVFVLMTGFAGWDILLVLGPVMAVYGAVYALLQNDIRRLIAYHIMSQVGFMVTAIGVGTHGAEEAVADQAFTHVLWPAVMVMAAGAIMHATGTTKLTQLGGLAKPLRAVFGLYMVGAISISLFPLLVGLGAAELFTEHGAGVDRPWPMLALLVASVGATLAVAVKLPYYAFFGPQRTPTSASVPLGMLVALGGGAVLSLMVGLAPATTFDLLRLELHPHGFASAQVIFGLELFALSLIAGWALLPRLAPRDVVTLDTDWFYRKAGKPVRRFIQEPLEWPFTQAGRLTTKVVAFAGRISLAPEQGWSRLLSLRGEPATVISLLGRPPLGVAVVAMVVTFSAVLLIAAAFD